MAERLQTDRLLPSLLDRLTDDAPDGAREPGDRLTISLSDYKEGVRRDLEWLFNSQGRLASPAEDVPAEVRRSVLQFGVPNLCGRNASSLDAEAIEQGLLEAIRAFEPRVVRDSVTVKVRTDADRTGEQALAIDIEADLWTHPGTEPVLIRTRVDLETGRAEVGMVS